MSVENPMAGRSAAADEPAEAGRPAGRGLARRGFLAATTLGTVGAAGLALAPTAGASPAKPKPRPVRAAAVHDVRHYGAVGNGTQDDTAALQAAIDAAASAGGGAVYLPSGRYVVSATLKVNSSAISLYGDGASSIVSANFAAGDVIAVAKLPSASGNVANTRFEDFAIVSTVSKTSGAAMSFSYVEDVRIVNVQAVSRDQAAIANNLYDSFSFRNFSAVLMDNVMVQAQNIGVSVVGDAAGFGADIWITGGSLVVGCTLGVYVGGGVGGLYLDEVDIFGNGAHVLIDDVASGTPNREIIFNNCVLDTAGGHGVEVMPNGVYVLSFNATYGGNTGTNGQAGHPDGCIVRVHAGAILHPSNVVVNGCKFFNAYGSAIFAESGYWTITGSDLSVNGQGTNGGYGVILSGSATSNSTVVGNSARLNGMYPSTRPVGVGIQIGAGVDGYVVSGNVVTDNATAGVVDLGGPNKAVSGNVS